MHEKYVLYTFILITALTVATGIGLEKLYKSDAELWKNKYEKLHNIFMFIGVFSFYFAFASSVIIFESTSSLGIKFLDNLYEILKVSVWGPIVIYGQIFAVISCLPVIISEMCISEILNRRHRVLINKINLNIADCGLYIDLDDLKIINTSSGESYTYLSPYKFRNTKKFSSILQIALVVFALSWLGVIWMIYGIFQELITFRKEVRVEADEAQLASLCHSEYSREEKQKVIMNFCAAKDKFQKAASYS